MIKEVVLCAAKVIWKEQANYSRPQYNASMSDFHGSVALYLSPPSPRLLSYASTNDSV